MIEVSSAAAYGDQWERLVEPAEDRLATDPRNGSSVALSRIPDGARDIPNQAVRWIFSVDS